MALTVTDLKKAKAVGLFGLGVSNFGIAEFLKHFGKKKIIIRSDTPPAGISDIDYAECFTGEAAYKNINEDILFLSPSVKRERGELNSAREGGCIISSDTEAFFDLTKCPVYAVSGSDGKSTTCEIAYRLLRSGNENTHKSGNCGRASVGALDIEGPGHRHILELSSFMLEYIKPRLRRSVITNISENHLNWHGSFKAYIKAKENILENTEEAALWYDGGVCEKIAKRRHADILISKLYSAKELAGACDTCITLEDGRICIDGKPALTVNKIKRSEPYNICNFMSALALSLGEYDPAALYDIAAEFGGIEHRCMSLGVFGGTEYIDSSIDSTPERTRQTLFGLSRRVVLILGGRGKGLSYTPLCDAVKKFCDAVIINGENSDDIKCTLLGDEVIKGTVPIYSAQGLPEAVDIAKGLGKKVVLLSPASTSYNEFKNFEDRGDAFRKLISKNRL